MTDYIELLLKDFQLLMHYAKIGGLKDGELSVMSKNFAITEFNDNKFNIQKERNKVMKNERKIKGKR